MDYSIINQLIAELERKEEKACAEYSKASAEQAAAFNNLFYADTASKHAFDTACINTTIAAARLNAIRECLIAAHSAKVNG